VKATPKALAQARRARRKGRERPMIGKGVIALTIDEILEPVREDFAKTGMSQKKVLELGRRGTARSPSQEKSETGVSAPFTTRWFMHARSTTSIVR
jgi:hypothetical protein